MLQTLYLLACRSLTRPNRELGRWSNPSVYAGIGVVLGLQALFVFAPFMQRSSALPWLAHAQGLAPAAATTRVAVRGAGALGLKRAGDVDVLVIAGPDHELLRQAVCQLPVAASAGVAPQVAEQARR